MPGIHHYHHDPRMIMYQSRPQAISSRQSEPRYRSRVYCEAVAHHFVQKYPVAPFITLWEVEGN